ncbi:MAG: hypothetical protein QOJ64_1656 [Acidobacteriota bacterium]|jgi:hypothetical protein|nr:hypothetical protein [Acidobacteriota bacterium]
MGANPLQRSLFCLLIGAAFSLWRASFLTEVRRGWPGVLAGAEKFLTAVVRDNAIGYNQEKSAQKWMVGFYLNSAAFRIDAILRNRASGKKKLAAALRSGDFSEFQKLFTTGLHAVHPSHAWEVIYNVLARLVENLLPVTARSNRSARRRRINLCK